MASALTPSQLGELRRRLEAERTRIRRLLGSTPAAGPDAAEPELEEAAQRTTEQAHALEVMARERALLVEVERALARMADGSYGVSEVSGDPIPYERLAAVPWARRGVDE